MINENDVKVVLLSMGTVTQAELVRYEMIIGNAIKAVEHSLKNPADAADARIVFLAAARANYQIALLRENDGVSVFKAGDVSLTRREGFTAAERLLESAKADCASLIADNGFVFMGV